MKIREATQNDYNEVWEIFYLVIKNGDVFVFDPKTPKEDMVKYWLSPDMHTFVLEENGEILGSYFLKANQVDLGSHIANGGYMTHPNALGKGIAKMMCEHSLQKAKELGFQAMQFNMVVSTNKAAIKIWKNYGFKTIGIIPKAFNHIKLGLQDALIMYREL